MTGTAAQLVKDSSRVLHERQSPSHFSNIRILSTVLYWCGAKGPSPRRIGARPDHPAVGKVLLRVDVPPGLTLVRLRQDGILNAAAETAVPLRLVRLFGMTEKNAMRYVTAAHSEQTAKLPR
ncbi:MULTISPECIES: hypothetical protein [Streptomyces]|uniref:Uncharacterized protein n=1 Tax=Streptomyces lienomycini TaxID=284035 RepID=A0ABV9X3M0_9ACTN|nr:hypothetical protein [Streptomyces lienomycini]